MSTFIINKTSPEWILIQEYCEDRLQQFRIDNDRNLPEIETARLRGNIEFAKAILELGTDKEKIEVTSTNYID